MGAGIVKLFGVTLELDAAFPFSFSLCSLILVINDSTSDRSDGLGLGKNLNIPFFESASWPYSAYADPNLWNPVILGIFHFYQGP